MLCNFRRWLVHKCHFSLHQLMMILDGAACNGVDGGDVCHQLFVDGGWSYDLLSCWLVIISGGVACCGVDGGYVCHQSLVAGGRAAFHCCRGNAASVWSSNAERDSSAERLWWEFGSVLLSSFLICQWLKKNSVWICNYFDHLKEVILCQWPTCVFQHVNQPRWTSQRPVTANNQCVFSSTLTS